MAGVLLTVATIEAFTFGKLWSKASEPFEKYVWERELFNPEMDPRIVILMLKPFQLLAMYSFYHLACHASSFQVPNLLPRLRPANPFLLTNRKYLEHKSSRITAPICLFKAVVWQKFSYAGRSCSEEGGGHCYGDYKVIMALIKRERAFFGK